ncbi:MAG: hypothetical protein WBG50_09200 [Desulfomonilaceae bacterium]
MKTITATVMVVALIFFITSLALADGVASLTRRGHVVTTYNSREKCQVICTAPTPFLERVENALAYTLDIPLAILSPITCPVVSPLLDRIDPVENRSYARTPRKR